MKNEKLPHYLKAIIVSDPELVAILSKNTKEDNANAFDFKAPEFKTALTGVLLGSNSFELFKKILPDLIDDKDFNISYLKECLYFAVPFLGIASVYPFLKEVAKFVGKNELSLSKQDYAVSDDAKNIDLRHRIFDSRTGFGISENDATNTFKKSIDEFVFKKFYERTLLTYKTKELLALFIVLSSNASAQTLTEHVNAALKTGNTKEELLSLIEATSIFSGYIKSSEAIRAVKNAKKVTVITSLDKVKSHAKEDKKSDKKTEDKSAAKKDTDDKSDKKADEKAGAKEANKEQTKSKKKDKKSDSKDLAKAEDKLSVHEDKTNNDNTDAANLDAKTEVLDGDIKADKKDKALAKQKKSHKK